MKKIIGFSLFGLVLSVFVVLMYFNFASTKATADTANNTNMSTNVTFNVYIGTPDCPALQYCNLEVVVYYEQTQAEIGSKPYVYGTSLYKFGFSSINDNYRVCAKLKIIGECNYPLTIGSDCLDGPFVDNGSYNLFPLHSCN
jgi:hypothetical protein